jgi:thiol-disulfide isomerase/thioredoxin
MGIPGYMRQPPGQTLTTILLIVVAALLFQNLSCAQTPFVPFNAPDMAIDQWLTPNPPQKADLIGRPYVIEFWASWCPPCQQSIKHMTELQNRHAGEGLIIIALAQDSSVDTVRTFISQKNINYNVAMDSGNGTLFSVTQIPTVFVVDHRGQVVWRGFPWNAEFDTMVRKVLEEAPPPVTSGTSLGAFQSYRNQLRGGPGFAAAYNDIKAQSELNSNPNAASARGIILAIDLTITRKTNQAHVLRYTEPASAYRIYAELARKYGGIPVTQPAVSAMAAMKEGREIKPDMYAAQ